MCEKDCLPHLRRLESESIFILREVAGSSSGPSCSIPSARIRGDAASGAKGLLPLEAAISAAPCGYTWKFREMIAFRDEAARRAGMELLVHINQDGLKRGISPVASGSSVHTQVMKTKGCARPRPLAFRRGFCGARRDEEKKPG